MEDLSFYPTLTEDLIEKCGCTCDKYTFGYFAEETYRTLRSTGKTSIKLEDSNECWKAENNGLRISRRVTVENPKCLYGKDGVVCSNACFDICIIWNSKTLTQTGYIKPTSVRHSGESIEYTFLYDFGPGDIKGDLTLDTVFYVSKEADYVPDDEKDLINEAGVIVGTVDSTSIDLGSLYMDFPIREVKDPDEPLWWLEFHQWEDPRSDPFSEDYVCLYLNTAYPNCPKAGTSAKNLDLLIEILSTAYMMIIRKIDDMGCLNDTLEDTDLEVGSISKIIYYFYTSSDPVLRTESIDMLHKTVHRNIEKMMKAGNPDELQKAEKSKGKGVRR